MKHYIKLLRPKDWAKNLFLFIPLFFAGKLFDTDHIAFVIGGFFAFCFMASSIYIINDYNDIEDDRKHPEKRHRPLASGKVQKPAALIISGILILSGALLAYQLDSSGKFLSILSIE